jgi:hypothetical protein
MSNELSSIGTKDLFLELLRRKDVYASRAYDRPPGNYPMNYYQLKIGIDVSNDEWSEHYDESYDNREEEIETIYTKE